jgi:DNA topoisomerase VI subunit B
MRRIVLAFRAFFLALFSGEASAKIAAALEQRELPAPVEEKPKPVVRPKPAAVRSEAVTLLATLQREARFVDFLQEPLAGYSDAQVGAVARDVHRDCGAVIQRLFGVKPVVNDPEGAEIELPAGFDSGRFRLVGNVAGEPPFRGRLVHHGWEASKCEVPAWTGSEEATRVVAPSEIELK